MKKTINNQYFKYKELRTRGTNAQINYLSKFAEKVNMDVREHILANWDPTLWTELESILMGGQVSEKTKDILAGWDKETRSFEEFLVKVFYAWIVEDYLDMWLARDKKITRKYQIQKGGSDALREFGKANSVKGDPDLRLIDKATGEVIHLEVTTDNTGFTEKYNALDLRVRASGTSKLNDLKAKSHEQGVRKVFIMMIDVVNGTIRFLEINDSVEILKVFDNPAWNYKRCMRVSVPDRVKRFALAA